MPRKPVRRGPVEPVGVTEVVVPELRALANPKPLRDLMRGVAYAAVPEFARALADPAVKIETKQKIWDTMLKFSVGLPSMAEIVAAASGEEVQEAKALGLLKEALNDPGVRDWVLAHRPELLRGAVPVDLSQGVSDENLGAAVAAAEVAGVGGSEAELAGLGRGVPPGAVDGADDLLGSGDGVS